MLSVDNVTGLEDLISSYAFDQGSLGSEVGNGRLRIYFPSTVHIPEVIEGLKKFLHRLGVGEEVKVSAQTIQDPGWDLLWREYFEPLWINEDLLIVAPWHQIPSPRPRHVIIMDPGPAFGTGRHATTRLCLVTLRRLSEELRGPWELLDVGTGSGILAIYGAMLGANPVLGIDRDMEALRWAKRSVSLNRLHHRIILSDRSLDSICERFLVVVSNISLDELVRILPQLRAKLKEDGVLVLGGILSNEKDEMIDHLSKLGLRVDMDLQEEGWVSLCAKRGA